MLVTSPISRIFERTPRVVKRFLIVITVALAIALTGGVSVAQATGGSEDPCVLCWLTPMTP
jgi:disulfide bond formation protein DsbB